MLVLINADIWLTNLISNMLPHNKLFDIFFSFFSFKGSAIIIWIIVIIAAVIVEEIFHPGIQLKDIKFVVIFLLVFVATSLTTNVVIKHLVHRPRPCHLTPNTYHLTSDCPSDYSFPSTHAALAFSSAVVLTAFDKKRQWFYYGLAIIISLSRIYLGVHYFLDVAAGGMVGYLIGKIILKINLKKIHLFFKDSQ